MNASSSKILTTHTSNAERGNYYNYPAFVISPSNLDGLLYTLMSIQIILHKTAYWI